MGACGSKGSTSDKGLASDKEARTPRTARKRGSAFARRFLVRRPPRQNSARIELFKKFDKNETGKLCYDEVYSGCLEVLKLDEFTSRVRDITKRAFDKARPWAASWRTRLRGLVEFLEFRLMLCYIYDFFELTVMFDEIDASGNMLVDEEEFKRPCPSLRRGAPRSRIPRPVQGAR
ncbi:flagellar calcium-binding 24 kDa protein [Trypanosoma cruzi]|nr:flagellar calcium-binding 24 kDa protein [Trypanosoma cruzi]